MTTNVPQIQFTDSGLVIPSELDVLAGVQADIDSAFGGGVDPDLSTPQGQLAQSMTKIIGDKDAQILELANNFNPDYATGRFQDALAKIYFIERNPAEGTVVTATCTGQVGTTIPAGAAAQDASGYIYYSTGAATIGADGTVQVQFQNSTTGPIPCLTGNLNKIYIRVIGWDSVYNNTDGVLGTNEESRADFEARRRASVALNSKSLPQSVKAAVLNLPNVLDCFVVDNPLGTSVTYGATSYTLVKNSIVVSVAGGASADIANAIWSKKSGGCNYNGNTSATVEDKEGYSPPYPTYTVTWLTPTPTQTYFKIEIVDNPNLPADIVTRIQNAVISSFNGQDGGARVRIGSSTYAGRYYAGIAATDANVQILSVLMGFSLVGATQTSLEFGIDQLPSISASNIQVTLV